MGNDNTQEKQDNTSEIPSEFSAILDSVPEEKRAMIESTLIAGFSIMGQNSPDSAIAKKLNPEHISQFLAMSEKDMHNHYKEKTEQKIFIGFILIAAFIFFLLLVNMLRSNTEVLEKIISAVVGLVAGAIGGYGFGRSKKDE